MIKKLKLSLILLILNLTTSFADNHQIQIQQTLDYLKDSLNQHQFKSLSPHLSQEFKFQDYSGDMAQMIYQQIVNQYPKTIETIKIISIKEINDNFQVRVELQSAKETESKQIVINKDYKIVQADIVNIHMAGHQSAQKQKPSYKVNQAIKVVSPFKLVGGLIMVDAEVNGIKGNFMVDTGAMNLIVNSKQFPMLDKQAVLEQKSSYGVGGKVKNQKKIEIDSFKWQSLEFNDLKASYLDLTQLEKSINNKLFGIIGSELLHQFSIEFDYENKQIILFSEDPLNQWSEAPDTSLDFKMISHIPVIEIQVADKKLLFGIDSGAEGAMLMTRWEKPLEPNYEFHRLDTLNGIDGNKQITKVVKLDEFIAGGQSYKYHQFVIADIQWGHESIIDGLLGYEFLSSRRTAIDFNNQKIYFWN